jgi:hypothetical protein
MAYALAWRYFTGLVAGHVKYCSGAGLALFHVAGYWLLTLKI